MSEPDRVPAAPGNPVSDERLQSLIEEFEDPAPPIGPADDHWIVPVLVELRHRRAAQTASAERVRAVVREACQRFGYTLRVGDIDAIVARVAAQLTGSAADAPPTASETRILDLQAAVGYEIERRDAALARVAELEGQLARLRSAHDLTAGPLTGAGQRIAVLESAVARMAPVVAAADAWLDDQCKGLGSYRETALATAVKVHRWSRGTAPAEGDPGWRAGIEASIRRLEAMGRKPRDLWHPAYFAAVDEAIVHLRAMLERGAERVTTPVAGTPG